jgi:CSLREA domain-containing protein
MNQIFRFALALASVFALPAAAATFTVTSETDVPDDNTGDGVCHPELALPGVCTLRAAIQEANALAGHDTINLSAGQVYALERVGQDATAFNGDLDITDDVTIAFFASGERPVVDANGLERAFEIHDGNVLMLGFDIIGGDATIPSDAAGGGIAINFDAGVVQLSLLRIHGNRAEFGGGVYNDGSGTTLTFVELYENENNITGNAAGSAIFNRGELVLEQSAVFGNSTDMNGTDVIRNEPPFSGSPALTVINSTIASNLGNGIRSIDDALLVVRNSTIAHNIPYGVAVTGAGGTFQMRNSVLAYNAFADCGISPVASLNLNRYNMDSDGTCELADGSSNYPGVEPYLTPLARHGGFTHASWPLSVSPMIDLGHPVIGSIGCEEDDQQGTERPVDFDGNGNARCDVGAIELDSDLIFFDPIERLGSSG